MTSYGKVLSIVVIVALIMSVFFVFGAHEFKNHFCPISVTTGICGFLGNLTQIIDHIFSMNIFLVLVLPVFISFLAAFLLYERFFLQAVPIKFYNPGLSFVIPQVKISESRWLRLHINSPTL